LCGAILCHQGLRPAASAVIDSTSPAVLFDGCVLYKKGASPCLARFVLPIRNILNAIETLVSEVHQHGTASEGSWREQKNFFDRCGSQLAALAHLHRLVAFATNCSQKQESG